MTDINTESDHDDAIEDARLDGEIELVLEIDGVDGEARTTLTPNDFKEMAMAFASNGTAKINVPIRAWNADVPRTVTVDGYELMGVPQRDRPDPGEPIEFGPDPTERPDSMLDPSETGLDYDLDDDL